MAVVHALAEDYASKPVTEAVSTTISEDTASAHPSGEAAGEPAHKRALEKCTAAHASAEPTAPQ